MQLRDPIIERLQLLKNGAVVPGGAGASGEALVRTVERLRKPSQNHAANDGYTPAIERVIVPDGAIEKLRERYGIRELVKDAKLPLRDFFLRYENLSYDVEQVGQVWIVTVFVVSNPQRDFPIAAFSFLFPDTSLPYEEMARSLRINRLLPDDQFAQDDDRDFNVCILFVVLCGALSRGRMVMTRRSHNDPMSRAAKMMAIRRAQRGVPIFSDNIVDWATEQTSIQRSEKICKRSFFGRRKAEYRGTWRLHDRNPEPFWSWVRPYSAGNERLGVVSKTRIVSFEMFRRRGFVAPDFVGQPGQRVKAIKAQ